MAIRDRSDAPSAPGFKATGTPPLSRFGGLATRCTAADLADLRPFLAEHFGAGSHQARPAHLEWLHRRNPEGDPERPAIWIGRRGGRILGVQCGIPVALKLDDRVVRALWAVDLMVAPAGRLTGLGPALSEAHAAASDLPMAVWMSDAAYAMYQRLGWTHVGDLSRHVRLLDPGRALAGWGGSDWLRLAARAAGPALRAAEMTADLLVRAAGVRLVEEPRVPDGIDGLWRRVSAAWPVMAMRDARALGWRFDDHPEADRFRRFSLWRGGALVGWLVLRQDRWRGRPVTVVIDYMAEPRWVPALLAHAIRASRAAGSVAVLCRTLNRRCAAAFVALGFAPLPARVGAPVRFAIRPGADLTAQAERLSAPSSWFLTEADCDLSFQAYGDRQGEAGGQQNGQDRNLILFRRPK